jgi:hypothetical protein
VIILGTDTSTSSDALTRNHAVLPTIQNCVESPKVICETTFDGQNAPSC